MLEVDNISAGYGNGDVVKDLSFIAIEREIYVLLGANGAVKPRRLEQSPAFYPFPRVEW